jgi:hypothetical protein
LKVFAARALELYLRDLSARKFRFENLGITNTALLLTEQGQKDTKGKFENCQKKKFRKVIVGMLCP